MRSSWLREGTSHVSRLTSHVSRLTSHVSRQSIVFFRLHRCSPSALTDPMRRSLALFSVALALPALLVAQPPEAARQGADTTTGGGPRRSEERRVGKECRSRWWRGR